MNLQSRIGIELTIRDWKVDPKLLKMVAKKIKSFSPIYIGDTARDKKMAEAAGITFISSQKLLSSRRKYDY